MSTKICAVTEFDTRPSMGFVVLGQSIFLVKQNDQFFCYVNACPHIGTPLEFKEHQFLCADQHYIQCSMHGALFERETGLCIHGPCSGQHLEPIDIDIKDGWIMAKIEAGA